MPRSLEKDQNCREVDANMPTDVCSGDLGSALESPTGYPFMAIFKQATGSTAGTAVILTVLRALEE
jgi:hypothetical protein